jgi:hypothetical protein
MAGTWACDIVVAFVIHVTLELIRRTVSEIRRVLKLVVVVSSVATTPSIRCRFHYDN